MPTMEIEIALRAEAPGSYGVQLRVVRSDSEMIIQPAEGRTGFDLEALGDSRLSPLEYGRLLSGRLFAPAEIGQRFAETRAAAETDRLRIRLRLQIHSNAPELHALRWENLTDPRNGEWLLTSETLIFSRLVAGADWQRVALRPRSQMQALVAAANPSDLQSVWNLPPIDPAKELERARAGLEDKAQPLEGVPVTLPNLAEALRRKDYDILYLACHGALRDGEPWLLLEDENGKAARIGGAHLVEHLRSLEVRPRLVVLASCESAGTGQGAAGAQALAALGPRLAEAGIPAVLAMQGSVSVETLARLLPDFFQALWEDGRVDYALAVARSRIRDRPDRWMPALFLRLKNGRIWYVPGFAGEETLRRWDSLLNNVHYHRCTPILGSGLLEPLVGTSQDLAALLAGEGFPLEPHEREDLPQVAQYLATMQQDQFVRDQWLEILQRELSRRFDVEPAASADTEPLPEDHVERLSASFSRAGALLRGRDPVEPHKVLASLPFPLYITTNPDSLLVDALSEAEKEPQVELCRWRQDPDLTWPPSLYDDRGGGDEDYVPSEKRPLVYYLFGRLQEPKSIVLTEDNYFDYLIGVSRPAQDSPHPEPVLRAQGGTSLLFLGFRLEEWDFRIFFRSLAGREGSGWKVQRKNLTHVAVQIDPEESRMLDAERARDYLRQYFGEAKIDIYWGSVADFLRELIGRWEEWRKKH
ncbi:MAG: CHAT domain-containing protein [Acidobacteriota bacterium]